MSRVAIAKQIEISELPQPLPLKKRICGRLFSHPFTEVGPNLTKLILSSLPPKDWNAVCLVDRFMNAQVKSLPQEIQRARLGALIEFLDET